VTNREFEIAKEAEFVQNLYKKTFTTKVGAIAKKKARHNLLNNEKRLPSSDDVSKLHKGIKGDIYEIMENFKENHLGYLYDKLSTLVMGYLMVYNKKRSGELGKVIF